MLGIGSDGASSMTGHLQGVDTRLVNQSTNKIYRIWCGLHQLDLVLKHAYKELWDNEVVEIMKKFIAHLRQHEAVLITEMQATCPQLSTRWLVMGKVCEWLLLKRIRLLEYIDNSTNPALVAPPVWWWIVIHGIGALTEIINPVFTNLQSNNLLILTQTTLLDELAVDICNAVGNTGPCSADEIQELKVSGFNCTCGKWSVTYACVMEFLKGLQMYRCHALVDLSDELHHKVTKSVGILASSIVDSVTNIQVKRDNRNNAADDLPAVLPHELFKISTAAYSKHVVDKHLRQLWQCSSWSEEVIAEIENQHRQYFQ